MTKRERFLKALRNEPVDELVWAPNLDYWLAVNRAEGTLPKAFEDLSRNDIVRAIGGHIWNRAAGYRSMLDKSVKEVTTSEGDDDILELHTPLGVISQAMRRTEGAKRSKHLSEHFIKDLDSLRILKYVVEATNYEPDYSATQQAIEETGDDGVVLNMYLSIPFIQFAKIDTGYLTAFYLWSDHKEEVDALLDVYFRKFLEISTILADGPADMLSIGDNMDGIMISPPIFREYALPFYQEVKKITEPRGKILQSHWCGRTQNLLPFVSETNLDSVEAVVTQPMADITLSDALDRLDGRVVMQGGIPAVLVCNEGGTRDNFERYMEEVVLPHKGRKGFILGMSDNVPPNADFSRVERVAEIIS